MASEEAEAALEEHEERQLLSVAVQIRGDTPPVTPSLDASEQIDYVIIEVDGPQLEHDPMVADTLHARISRHAEAEVVVQVRFMAVEER